MLKKVLRASLLVLSVVSLSAFAKPAAKAPDWELKTQSGEVISSEQFKGKPTILHFWATWCSYCKRLQPKLLDLQEQYKDSDVQIVAISFDEDEGAKPQSALDERGFDMVTAVNGEKVAEQYGVRGTPTTFYISKKGNIIYKSTSSSIKKKQIKKVMEVITK